MERDLDFFVTVENSKVYAEVREKPRTDRCSGSDAVFLILLEHGEIELIAALQTLQLPRRPKREYML